MRKDVTIRDVWRAAPQKFHILAGHDELPRIPNLLSATKDNTAGHTGK